MSLTDKARRDTERRQRGLASMDPQRERELALADTSRTVYMIVFDDTDRSPEIVIGDLRARYRFREVSVSWNAHLFGKIKSNSRDDPRYADNIQSAAGVLAQRSEHVCGLQGYNGMIDPPCPGCERNRAAGSAVPCGVPGNREGLTE